jgi:hypothetical protein
MKSRKTFQKHLSCYCMFLISIFYLSHCEGQPTKQVSDVDSTIAEIVRVRQLTAQYVVLSKSSFKQGSAEYNKAFGLYAIAYSNYSAWNAYMASALASGRIKSKKPILTDSGSEYDELSSKATKSSTEFVSYVTSNIEGESKAVTTILSSLADLGVKLWTEVSQKNAQDRAAASKRFLDATTWQSWNQITDGGQPSTSTKAPESSPASPTSQSRAPQVVAPH